MSDRQPVDGLPDGVLEVRRRDGGEVVGWLWEVPAEHLLGRSHWRFATSITGEDGEALAYASPFGFLERQYALARVAVIKGIVSHHLCVEGD